MQTHGAVRYNKGMNNESKPGKVDHFANRDNWDAARKEKFIEEGIEELAWQLNSSIKHAQRDLRARIHDMRASLDETERALNEGRAPNQCGITQNSQQLENANGALGALLNIQVHLNRVTK